jgi:TPR repeat protein
MGPGRGVQQDLVEAYRWFDIAASRNAGTDFEAHDNAVRNRNTVAAKMTPEEIAKAQKLAKDWKPN